MNRLLGYVGERPVADILIHQGHTVEFAATANQPVWDMLVDGHAANVKTVAEIASIKAEAAAHPDILYFVPEDAHGHAVDNVVQVTGFNHEAAKESIKESLAAAKGESAAHGLFHHLPWITIAFAAYRNIKAVEKGKDRAVAFEHAIAESVGRGVGVLGGAKIGTVVGVALLGPIGALLGGVLGGIGGALLGGAVAEDYKQRPLRKALDQLERSLDAFGSSFKPQIDSIRGYFHAPLTWMQRSVAELEKQVQRRKMTLRWIIWPDFCTVLLEEAAKRGGQQIKTEQANVAQLDRVLDEAQQTGRYTEVGLLMVNSPVVRELVGFDADLLKDVTRAQDEVFYQRKQLNPEFQRPDGKPIVRPADSVG